MTELIIITGDEARGKSPQDLFTQPTGSPKAEMGGR
jgi:hypothetical protein